MLRLTMTAALLSFSAAALAQSAMPVSDVRTTTTSDAQQSPMAAGDASLTEAQARGRLAKAGYGRVQALKKDETGMWQGVARKAGKTIAVALDGQGNVVTR